ncbi:MAG: hypothetical protein IKC03_04445 [Oscillospiraceae bacterium]|nr:hypothetical protein [Oscillospiraceae bacterium]
MSLLDFFKLKDKHDRTSKSGNGSFDAEVAQEVANKTYPGLAIYVRDVNLSDEFADKYVPGLIIREKAFVDASDRVMGMITTHRYLILSNHMAHLAEFEQGTNWGLCVANRDSHFKVLGKHTYRGKTAIVLLHLPDDESWKIYKNCRFSTDDSAYETAIKRFEAKCEMPPVAELTTPEWLERCEFPVGMDSRGNLWEIE